MKQMNAFRYYVLLIAIVIFYTGYGQAGISDPTFNSADNGFGNGFGPNATVYASAVQGDDKIIIAGAFTTYNKQRVPGIVRLTKDGAIDPTFFTGVGPGATGGTADLRILAIQDDGKVIAGGIMDSYDGATLASMLIRLNTDGSLDNTFNAPPSIFYPNYNNGTYMRSCVIQPDGKILVAMGTITRLKTDGSLDSSFIRPAISGSITAISLQDDDHIIISGSFDSVNHIYYRRIARLQSNGAIDPSFNAGKSTNGLINSTIFQPDGKILIGGSFSLVGDSARRNIARLYPNGTVDETFQPGRLYAPVNDMALEADGSVIAAGSYTQFTNDTVPRQVMRLFSDGSLDQSFITDLNIPPNFVVYSVNSLKDNDILIGGVLNSGAGIIKGLYKLKSGSPIDPSFNPVTGFNNSGFTLFLQKDNKILAGGTFDNYNNFPSNTIVRLLPDGTTDSSFHFPVNTAVPGTGVCINQQSDGKILLGGDFGHSKASSIARLLTNGTIDTTFKITQNPSNPFAGTGNVAVNNINVLPDDRLIVTGNFTKLNGSSKYGITKLLPNGATDTSFRAPLFNGPVFHSAVQPDGKIIVVGRFQFKSADSTFWVKNIARLNSNGRWDSTFAMHVNGGADNDVGFAALGPDGKIIITGSFTTFKKTPYNRVARLTADGDIDTTFIAGSGTDNMIYSTVVQPDKKIVVFGIFGKVNGIDKPYMARLNENGTLDNSFNTGTGPDDETYCGLLQGDGKIVFTGKFTSYNGKGKNGIARVFNDITLSVADMNGARLSSIYPNPNKGRFHIVFNAEGEKSIAVSDAMGRNILNMHTSNMQETVDVQGMVKGMYFITVAQQKQTQQFKIVVE
jgi:uncharacterized delta-60 repeat protein